MTLAEYLRASWEGRLSGNEAWHYQSPNSYSVSKPEIRPSTPFDPRRQTAPIIGTLEEIRMTLNETVRLARNLANFVRFLEGMPTLPHPESRDHYVVANPDVYPFPPFDPWRQAVPAVGILGECAYCWEAIVPVPSVLTLVYTP